jgi:transcriptional regulator with XRE-family HTH domain
MEDPRQEFALLLRQRRMERKLSQSSTAKLVRVSQSTISRTESTTNEIPPELAQALDQAFGTDGEFKALYEEVMASSFPVIYRQRMSEERSAVAIAEWSPTIVPGLFQTDGYARAIIKRGSPRATEAEITKGVDARLARREILHSDTPPDIRVVLCESVIRRRIGGVEAMREQLSALLEHSERPTVRVQVLPLDAEPHLFIDYPVSILTRANHVSKVYGETYRTAGAVDDPDHVRAALRAYDDITGDALSPRESARLIREQMETL